MALPLCTIWTDASVRQIDGVYGFGSHSAVTVCCGKAVGKGIRGEYGQNSTYHELCGVRYGLELGLEQRYNKFPVLMFTDAMSNLILLTESNIFLSVIRDIRFLVKEYNHVELIHVPGHNRLKFNELADVLAKDALTYGISSYTSPQWSSNSCRGRSYRKLISRLLTLRNILVLKQGDYVRWPTSTDTKKRNKILKVLEG
jgi:ribonuclease HI